MSVLSQRFTLLLTFLHPLILRTVRYMVFINKNRTLIFILMTLQYRIPTPSVRHQQSFNHFSFLNQRIKFNDLFTRFYIICCQKCITSCPLYLILLSSYRWFHYVKCLQDTITDFYQGSEPVSFDLEFLSNYQSKSTPPSLLSDSDVFVDVDYSVLFDVSLSYGL